MRILIVEDNAVLANGLTESLRTSGYAVDWSDTGEAAIAALDSASHDLVILDLGLPDLHGFEVLKHARAHHGRVPVLILSARDGIEDRVAGLDLGADDYMVKPFNLRELEARVRALIRRGQTGSPSVISIGSLNFDMAGRRASLGDEPIELSMRELGVLEILMLQAGRVVSKERMVEHLYDWASEASPNAIEVYIHRLRKKLEPSGVLIRTIRGLGYLLEAP